MTGKRAENVLEIKAYIFHSEVCDIYEKDQMSHRTTYL